MNIFDQYLDKIKKTLLDFSKKGDLILPVHLMELQQKYHLQNLIVIFQQMLQWFYLK